MQHSIRLLSACLIASLATSTLAGAPETLDDALKAAREKGAYVVAAVYGPECDDCARLEKETFADERVADWIAKRAVKVTLDRTSEHGQAVARRFGVDTVPMILFISSDGKLLGRQGKFVSGYRMVLLIDSVTNSDRVRGQKGVLDAWAGEDVVLATIDRADALVKQDKADEAFAEVVWAMDRRAAQSPSFQIGHMTKLMTTFAAVAKAHPPAMEDLKQRLAMAERKVVRSKHSEAYSMYVVREGYRALEKPVEIVRVFDEIRRFTPEGVNVAGFKQLIYAELLGAHRYEDLEPTVATAGDVDLFLEQASKTRREPSNVRFTLAARYEVLLGLGRFDDAEVVAEKLIAYADSPSTYVSLAQAAYRSGRSTYKDVERTRAVYESKAGKTADVATALAYLMASRSRTPNQAIRILEESKAGTKSKASLTKLDAALAEIKSGNIRMAAMTKREVPRSRIPERKRKY